MAKSIIEVSRVSRFFGRTKALYDVSLSVEKGTIHGLLGPNGAGKTTLIRILATLLAPSKGSATIDGFDAVRQPEEVRKIIGLAGQYAAVDDFLTGRETLTMVGSLYHLPAKEIRQRSSTLLERLGLSDAADRTVKTYSGGMRRRLDLGASLIGEPRVIFLDEPTTGLDPRTRLELWDIIKGLIKNGATILLTTQYLEEADALAQYITVIDRGTVVAKGTPLELKKSLGRDIIEVAVLPQYRQRTEQILAGIANGNLVANEQTGNFRLPAKEGGKTLLATVRLLEEGNIPVEEIALHRPSLNDVFLAVTDKKPAARIKEVS